MKKYIIIGNPINHSLSPKIHNYWFRKNNIEANYSKISPENNEIENIISDIKEKKIYGMNVTVPYKQSVIPHLEILSPIAKKTNSVNTVFNKNGMVYGDNTDVFGFEKSIKERNISVTKKNSIIYGAGGVVPSIIVALKNLGIDKIYVCNRTKNKVQNLKKNFPEISEFEWGKSSNFDIYINATSLGLKNSDKLNIDFSKVSKGKLFYDVIYNPPSTNFLIEANQAGHKIMNGLSMFLYQAQKAFEIWHGFLPKIDKELIEYIKDD